MTPPISLSNVPSLMKKRREISMGKKEKNDDGYNSMVFGSKVMQDFSVALRRYSGGERDSA
jgi:hypothetical protein